MSLTRVRDLMTTELFTLDQTHDFGSVGDMFKLKHIRHLPVVHNGDLVGLVTQRDLLRAQAKLLIKLTKVDPGGSDERVVNVYARDFMTSEGLATCEPSAPADDAARLMLDKKLGCVLVVEGKKLVGIITEADLVKWAVEMMAKARLEARGNRLEEE